MTQKLTNEQLLARAILGQDEASVLMTDAYKLSMAQAGFALREELFVLCFRKGGPFYIPFDLNAVVQALLPKVPSTKEAGFLTANGYPMTTAMEKAIQGTLTITCPPKGAWVGKGEPILSGKGPSFLASWPEALKIMLHYPIQIATAAMQGEREFHVTCADELQIVRLVEKELNEQATKGLVNGQRVSQPDPYQFIVHMDTAGYLANVRKNVADVIDALGGEVDRAFEVGLRAATCMQQHLMVLDVCESLGIRRTSNVYGAWLKYMIPVGTTGHEHQMRWGGPTADDRHGYRAIRDMRPEPPSFLFDTTDPINKGIQAAFEVIAEDLDRVCTMRFDSGDQDSQFLKIMDHCAMNLTFRTLLTLLFEDSYTAVKTRQNETFCDQHNWSRDRRKYGYGGFFVSQPSPSIYNRDRVSVGYKLACTAGVPKMKFSGSPGKQSIPGNPVILENNSEFETTSEGIVLEHVIAQEGEIVEGFTPIWPQSGLVVSIKTTLSPATAELVAHLTKEAGR